MDLNGRFHSSEAGVSSASLDVYRSMDMFREVLCVSETECTEPYVV